MDEKGRLAILTNVYTGRPIKSSGRGFLVIDYLRENKSAKQYLSELSHSDIMYSPFNLCIFEPQANHGYEAVYFKNTFKDESNGVGIQCDGPCIRNLEFHRQTLMSLLTTLNITETHVLSVELCLNCCGAIRADCVC